MASLSTGGGTSAVAASTHAGCQRFRSTDPLVVGMSRRAVAKTLGHADISAGIPEARWMRAMTFERLVRHDRFVSELLTTAVGKLGLPRPKGVRRIDCKVSVDTTAAALQRAHDEAVRDNLATMITGLAVPFIDMEADATATPVKPDFAIVVRQTDATNSTWLIMGDAKDFERVRSRIDDQRMLKGFLQVALGAESVAAWSKRPNGMGVHAWGALAVPRNAFLQPEAIVERLDDHRREVHNRAAERTTLLAAFGSGGIAAEALPEFVRAIAAEFDPRTCSTCALFNYCRSELRSSSVSQALLAELGIQRNLRAALVGLVDGTTPLGTVPDSVAATVRATVAGRPQWTGQRRIDPIGQPGTIDVVLAKSDSAALGVHGIGVRLITHAGAAPQWRYRTFAEPQSPATRLAIVRVLGEAIDAAMSGAESADFGHPDPVHLVVPDTVTADVLVSIADSLAGVETSRLRWARDLEMGRTPLTFNGDEATVPAPLTPHERLGVSFLLEEDRSRAMKCRNPIVDARRVLAEHVVPGGPAVDAGRLDYLVTWAEATTALRHRDVSDSISASAHTPGARLSNEQSDVFHKAARTLRDEPQTRSAYDALVRQELEYKADAMDRAQAVLASIPASRLSEAHRELERDAQVIWRRRLVLHASDLVRFGRTSWVWRNTQVSIRDADDACATKLRALGNGQVARDLARNAGTREVAMATVVSVAPLRLAVRSRRITAGSTVVALHSGDTACIEATTVDMKIQKGSFKFSNMHIGALTADTLTPTDGALRWDPKIVPSLAVGDELVVADATWFGKLLTSGHQINVARPATDKSSAPKDDCDANSYIDDPSEHQWCCRPHEIAEAEFADILAGRRERGELNPQAWPPIVDEDEFDTPARGTPTSDTEAANDAGPVPSALTLDDLD